MPMQASQESPIFGIVEDYSQYVPRGHYTRSDALKKYFKAMMWYGRMPFYLYQQKPGVKEPDKEHTRQAIMIALTLKGQAYDLWKLVYDPTVFFVGETDDLSIYDYQSLIREVYGDTVALSDLEDDGRILSFIEKAATLRSPKIESTLVMEGQPYDITKASGSWGSVLSLTLTFSRSSSMIKCSGRAFPLGLDVMAVLGSKRAYDILDGLGETKYLNYTKQFESLKAEFAALKPTRGRRTCTGAGCTACWRC